MELKRSWLAGVADVELMFPKYDLFNNYLIHSCFYKFPEFLKEVPFDAIIMTATFMGKFVGNYNSNNESWLAQYDFLKNSFSKKIVFAQDDYWFSEIRDNFYVNYGIDLVHLVCPEKSWDELVPNFILKGGEIKQGFTTCITPYIKSLTRFNIEFKKREFDLVYKGTRIPRVPNHIGEVKGRVGDIFLKNIMPEELVGFKLDLKNTSKILTGEDWYRYLGNSRAVLGSNSGSSVRLRNKEIRNQLLNCRKLYPEKPALEIENLVLDENDRSKNYTAISPRNVEAAALGTIQVLVEGSYSDMLSPHNDYLPLKEDGSNAMEILNTLRDTEKCNEIALNCKTTLFENKLLDSSLLICETIDFIRKFHYKKNDINFKEVKKRYESVTSLNIRMKDILTLIKSTLRPYFYGAKRCLNNRKIC